MKRVYYFDFLRAFAILSVVLMHSVAPYIRDLDNYSWAYVNFIDSIVRYSVPLFIMISGALLLSKKDLKISMFIKKRFTRILLPTVVWSLLYIYLYKNISFDFTIVKVLLNGPVYYHMWFMYMLISLYIAYPLLWGYVQKVNKFNIIYILIAWFLMVSIEPALQRFYGINIGIRSEVLTYYMGYFLLGYFLTTYNFKFKYSKIFYGVTSLIIIALTAYGTALLSETKLNLYFYGNVSPNVIILSMTVYLFFKEVDFQNIYTKFPFLHTFILHLSNTSLGIYLLHPIILNYIRHNSHFMSYDHAHFLQILISWLGTISISFLIIYLIRKTRLKGLV